MSTELWYPLMSYTRQLLVAFLISALAFVLFIMTMYIVPFAGPGEEETTFEIVMTGVVLLGLLISFILTISFGVSYAMWRINGGVPAKDAVPDHAAMPLGKRIKGAGVIFVIAMLSYASFFFF